MSITSTVNSLSSVYMVGKTAWNVYQILNRPSVNAPGSATDAYRPNEWADYGSEEEQMIYLAPNISEVTEVKTGIVTSQKTEEVTVGYFFDVFLRESHSGSVKITEHPVQGGANISDHAYNLPDTLTIEILVSDTMDSIVAGQFTGEVTKSVSAYEIIRSLKERRVLCSVRTRLRYYTNMLIESMTVNDDYKSAHSLRCSVSFKQIIMAVVATEYVKLEKKQAVQTTNEGNKSAEKRTSVIKQ
jgi:hypothetical protein